MFNAMVTQTHIIVKINSYPVITKAVETVKKKNCTETDFQIDQISY